MTTANCGCNDNVTMIPVKGIQIGIDSSLLGNGGGNGGGINYSFEEQSTGLTWVDGKKIYQKTIEYTGLKSGGETGIPLGVENIDNVIQSWGIGIDSALGWWVNVPHVHFNPSSGVTLWCDRNNCYLGSGYNRSNHTFYITVQYTCTDR